MVKIIMSLKNCLRTDISKSLLMASVFAIPNTSNAVVFSGEAFASVAQIDLQHIYYEDFLAGGLVFGGFYQPRLGSGLIGASAQTDIIEKFGASGNASVAVYGTDSSRNSVSLLDPNVIAEGAGVEPMVDIQASASGGVIVINNDQGLPTVGSGSATGVISVQHRVILNPEITIPETILDDVRNQLNNVPLQVLWSYSVQGFLGDQVTADASFHLSITSSTGDCAGGIGGQCGGFDFNFLPIGREVSGASPFTAVASRTGREAIYDIEVGASARIAAEGENNPGVIQAVIDPYLTVDPSWEYAEYFKVQQEFLT